MILPIRRRCNDAIRGKGGHATGYTCVLVSAILTVGLASGARAQTVDCAAPSGPVAQVICGDPYLIELDLDMGDAFRGLIRATPRLDRPAVLRSQRDWLIERNRCLGAGNVAECLRAEIEYRLTDISQGLASSVGTDQPFGRSGPYTEPAAEPQGPRETLNSVPLPDASGSDVNSGDPAAPVSGPVPPRVGGPERPVAPLAGDVSSPDNTTGLVAPVETGGDQSQPASPSGGDTKVAPPVNPVPLNDANAQEIATFLSSSIWRAEIASGIRPGTIYIFHANGQLLTADCVEAYRIGSWRIEGDGLRLEDGSGRDMIAKIVDRGTGYVRLNLTERSGNKVLDLVFRPARGPFACTGSR